MRVLTLAILIGFSTATYTALAADFPAPARKPGLWKQTITSARAGQPSPPMTSTICLDASVDKTMGVFGNSMGRQVCSKNTVTRTATGYTFASVCQMGGAGTTTSQGSATGDFSRAYKVAMRSTTTGAAMAAMNGASTTTIDAAWSGPCPAGQKPGDMTMPNGMRVNMISMMGAMKGR